MKFIAAVAALALVFDLAYYAFVSSHCHWAPWPIGTCIHTWHHVLIDGMLVAAIVLSLRARG